MPAGKTRRSKNYVALCPAGSDGPQTSIRIVPANPKRISLFIQNSGDTNTGLVRFEEPVQGDGGDISFQPGAGLLFDREDTCPQSAVNVGSTSGTTFCVVETIG